MIGAYGEEALLDENGQPRTSIVKTNVTGSSLPPVTQNPTYRPLVDDPSQKRLIGYDWDQTLPGLKRLYLHWQTEDGFQTEVYDPMDGQKAMPAWFGPWGLEVEEPTIKIGKQSYYVPLAQGIVWTGRTFSELKSLSPGETVDLAQNFISSRPVNRDLVVSLRLVGYDEDGFHWDWWDLDDGVPAMGAIPTLKWIAGSRVRDPRRPVVSESAWEDQEVSPLLRLYDAFTNRPLMILDERISQIAPWIPLGKAIVEE
jgi:hypothetical protein